MKKKRVILPKLDLSSYNDKDRIPGDVENIILQTLIVMEGNNKKVSNHFNVSEDIVNKVCLKYYNQIFRVVNERSKGQDLDDAINDSIVLMKGHLHDMKTVYDDSKSKTLRDREVSQLTRMCDRLINLKETSNRTFDTVVNKLVDQTHKFKNLELQESGKIEDNSDYEENQETVLGLLEQYTAPKYTGRPTEMIVKNMTTGEVMEFKTQKAMQNYFGTNMSKELPRLIQGKKLYTPRTKKFNGASFAITYKEEIPNDPVQ